MTPQKPTYTEALTQQTEAIKDLSARMSRVEEVVTDLRVVEAVQEEKFVSGRTVLVWIGASVVSVIGALASIIALKL